MKRMQKIKESPHYPQLKNSVEYQYSYNQFMLNCFVMAVLLVLVIFLDNRFFKPSAQIGLKIILIVLLTGSWLASAHRFLEIFLYIDSYIFFEAVLDQPHIEQRRRGSRVRFTVEFTDRHGRRHKKDTTAMFSGILGPALEEYNNQKVLLGYNEDTARLVVIKRIDA